MTGHTTPTGEETATDYIVQLTARLCAEPHVLADWSEHTAHPRLKDAYFVLMENVRPRAAELATALVEATPAARSAITQAAEEQTAMATSLTFEPSRLKWLLASRRDRLDHDNLPGYETHREQEQEEAEQLEALIDRVLRTMC